MASLILSIPFSDYDGHMGWDGGWSVFMVFGMIAFWGLVIVGMIWLLREIGNSRAAHAKPDDDPLRILDRRFAEGAISPDDYRERRAILTGETELGDQPPSNPAP